MASVEEACANGDLHAVERKLERSIHQIDMRHFSGGLRKAYAKEVNKPIVAYLLSKGVPARVSDFAFAAEKRSYELMELFLDRGYDVNASTDMSCPPVLRYGDDGATFSEANDRTLTTRIAAQRLRISGLPSGCFRAARTRMRRQDPGI